MIEDAKDETADQETLGCIDVMDESNLDLQEIEDVSMSRTIKLHFLTFGTRLSFGDAFVMSLPVRLTGFGRDG
jgi:hypothetical protein